MGMMNYAVNRLLERKDIFADFVNGTLFGGHDLIRSQNLELMSPNGGTIYKDKNGNLKVRETQGDIRMRANEQLYSVIVAAEPQYKVHYAMPVRVMEYVAMEYRKQIQDLEKKYREQMNLAHIGEEEQIDFISGISRQDKLTPVIALVFYCDTEKEWDGSKSLYEMIDWGEDTNVMAEMIKYMSDFHLNIIHINDMDESNPFKTSLHLIFEMLKYRKDKKQLQEYIKLHRNELNQLDSVETTAAFALLGQGKMVERLLLEETKTEKEEIRMCIALDEMMKDHELIGEVRGEARGEQRMNYLVQILLEGGKVDELKRAAQDSDYRMKLYKEFEIV